MIVRVINFFKENFMRLFCFRKYKKKEKLRKSDYILDFPSDFYTYPYGYSVYQRSILDPVVYTKYGRTYTFAELIKSYNI